MNVGKLTFGDMVRIAKKYTGQTHERLAAIRRACVDLHEQEAVDFIDKLYAYNMRNVRPITFGGNRAYMDLHQEIEKARREAEEKELGLTDVLHRIK